MQKKIGIMGGTFNPIHIGHLILGECAYEQFQLDQVLFMPVKNPPHKKGISIASDTHRKEMVELAIRDNDHFELSLVELNREGYTYTVDTLRELVANHPEHEYYFIMGGDSLFEFETWKCPQEILELATILATSRNHVSEEAMKKQIEHLTNKYHGQIELLKTPEIEISSKKIRTLCEEGKSIRYLLPTGVEEYIRCNHLYQKINEHTKDG